MGIMSQWWFWILVIALTVDILWIIKTWPKEIAAWQEYAPNDRVVFTQEAMANLSSADEEIHTVINVRHVCDSFFDLLNYPVQVATVGHTQWVTLENGKEYSGAHFKMA